MPCVFVTEVKEEPSAKREHQVPRSAGPAGLCLNPVWAPRRVGAALRTGLGAFFAVVRGYSRVGGLLGHEVQVLVPFWLYGRKPAGEFL